MVEDRLTAARARSMAQAAQNLTEKHRVDTVLGKILRSVADVARNKEFTLKHPLLPPDFDLVRALQIELQQLGYRVSVRDSAGSVEYFRPPERALVIEW